MLDIALPEDQTVPALTRSFAACVASVTETPVAEVPQPHADLPGAISTGAAGWPVGERGS